jgi:hypothetical protein
MRYWRFNFVHALSEKRLAVSTAEQPDLSALKLAHTRKTIYGSTRINSGTANGIRFDAVEVPYEVENLPKPWFSKQESVQSIARLKNGRVLQSQQNPFVDSYQADNWLKAAAIDMLGASGSPGSITTHFWRLGLFDAFCAPSEEFEHSKAESPLAGIEGEAVFTIARPKVLNILPLQPGASATSRHTRFTIRQVSRYPGRITVKVSVETGSVPLRGESSGEQVRNTIFLMGNPKTKTYFAAELDGSSFSTGIGFYSLREERLSVNLPSSADEASFGDLRLYIVITEEARQVQLPFRLVGKDLPEGD